MPATALNGLALDGIGLHDEATVPSFAKACSGPIVPAIHSKIVFSKPPIQPVIVVQRMLRIYNTVIQHYAVMSPVRSAETRLNASTIKVRPLSFCPCAPPECPSLTTPLGTVQRWAETSWKQIRHTWYIRGTCSAKEGENVVNYVAVQLTVDRPAIQGRYSITKKRCSVDTVDSVRLCRLNASETRDTAYPKCV